jgi:hypothetical protein
MYSVCAVMVEMDMTNPGILSTAAASSMPMAKGLIRF